jgi:uncharacterized protein (TIGR02453 family)
LWRPEAPLARQIRTTIVEDPTGWKKASKGKAFLDRFEPDGDSLARPPQGFDPDHPYIEDLQRKDFIAGTRVADRVVTSDRFLTEWGDLCKVAAPYMRFLTEAVGLPF